MSTILQSPSAAEKRLSEPAARHSASFIPDGSADVAVDLERIRSSERERADRVRQAQLERLRELARFD